MDEDIQARLTGRQWEDAFELVMRRYQDRIFRLAYSILGEQAAAEEAAQDALVKVWRALPRFRGQSSVSTWVYAITRNTALSARRRARPSVPLEQADIAVEPAAFPVDARALLADLPENLRRAVVLFHLEEKSYEEIAAMLEAPMGTVKTWLHRARKQLALAVERSKMTEGRH